MAAVLLPRPAFVQAVSARLDWLAENRDEEQIENFLAGLRVVRDLISSHPLAGPIMKEDGAHVLRMRIFPRPLPYLVYYGHASAHEARQVKKIYLVRLYGSGQDREDIDMSGWPW
jgi:plasmid stabilization system protein ParE